MASHGEDIAPQWMLCQGSIESIHRVGCSDRALLTIVIPGTCRVLMCFHLQSSCVLCPGLLNYRLQPHMGVSQKILVTLKHSWMCNYQKRIKKSDMSECGAFLAVLVCVMYITVLWVLYMQHVRFVPRVPARTTDCLVHISDGYELQCL